MGCSVRTNRHGYLAFRLFFDGLESHEGTKLRDTLENRRRIEARARVIDQEIRDERFDYLHWFPNGNLSARFVPANHPTGGRVVTLRGFFHEWSRTQTLQRTVTPKWHRNRESYIRTHVLPTLGATRLDELTPGHLTNLQARLHHKHLAASTNDRVIHSAFRGLIRDAEIAGYRVSDVGRLFDRRLVSRLDRGTNAAEIAAFTGNERERIVEWFRHQRPCHYAFVYFRFWTGTRPSEAIALRWSDVDLEGRRVKIRRSRVLGQDGQPKTGKSKRDVLIHEGLAAVLQSHMPRPVSPGGFVFTTPTGKPIDETNFYLREWRPALGALRIPPRPFYNTRHTYISTLLAAGAKPLFICRQTGTSLEMIEKHYGNARVEAGQLDDMICQFELRHQHLPGNPASHQLRSTTPKPRKSQGPSRGP